VSATGTIVVVLITLVAGIAIGAYGLNAGIAPKHAAELKKEYERGFEKGISSPSTEKTYTAEQMRKAKHAAWEKGFAEGEQSFYEDLP
jgi:hypothetical protein